MRRGACGGKWFVAETLVRKEQLAVQHLERQAFATFLPRIRKVRRHARKQDTVLVPLFPGYVFVRIDTLNHHWRTINGTFGVRRLVGAIGASPLPMPDGAMQHIFSRCENGVMTQILDRAEPGQAVRILTGPFAERLAIIETVDANGRIRVLMDLLGGETSIRIEASCLAHA